MKFGLLQALQNQLKSVEEVADAVGRPRRIDRLDGVAMILGHSSHCGGSSTSIKRRRNSVAALSRSGQRSRPDDDSRDVVRC